MSLNYVLQHHTKTFTVKFNGRNLDIIGEIYFWHYTEYYLQLEHFLGSYTSILSFSMFETVEKKE